MVTRERATSRTRKKVDAGVQSLCQEGMGEGTEAERVGEEVGEVEDACCVPV